MRPDDAARVEALVSAMTLDEKIGLIAGVDGFDVPGLARLGIPRLGTADSPFGVRATGPATLYPGGIGLAATWNVALARRVGEEIGLDMRARGRHYHLGPGVNIYRDARNGRNFEYAGEDPWLGARLAVAYVEGVQSRGVCSVIKHFALNQSEFARHAVDARPSERALREIYLPIFEAAVTEARVGAIMPAYNLAFGEYMTANRRLLVDVARGEWGFDGVMMSDWGAVHDAEGAANGGTDLEMPGPAHFNVRTLRPLVASGRVTEATIDEKVRRLLGVAARFGWLDDATADLAIPRYRASARATVLEAARESIVLLKNADAFLPLDAARARTVAVIGPTGFPGVPLGGGSASIPTYHRTSLVEGIGDRLGDAGSVLHHRGIPSTATVAARTGFTLDREGRRPGVRREEFDAREPAGEPARTRVDRMAAVGEPLDMLVLATGEPFDPETVFGGATRPLAIRWTGWLRVDAAGTYDLVAQLGGFMEAGWRVRIDGRPVADRWDRHVAIQEATPVSLDAGAHEVVMEYRCLVGFGAPYARFGLVRHGAWVAEEAVAMARAADAVVLALGYDDLSEAENWDRTFALPPGQEALAARVLGANPNAVVVLTGGGACDMRAWIDRVPAVLHAWYPGQEGGRALAEILFGDVSPSAHLPATFERAPEDGPAFAHWYPVDGSQRVEYAEDVFVGYRGYERNGVAPLFPFGHGLSYTTFAYADLDVRADGDGRWAVSFAVTNAGARAGAAVPQLYVADVEASVPRPPKELKGFAKVPLAPGETRRVTLPLDLRSLAFWDAPNARWLAEAGAFEVLVGESAADVRLRGRLVLDASRDASAGA